MLEFVPGLFRILLGAPGLEVFLELPRLRDEAVGNVENLTFSGRFARRGCIVNTLVQPRTEALNGIVGFVYLPQLLVVFGQVRGQDPCIVVLEVDGDSERGCSGVACEGVLEGREVRGIERRQHLIAEFSFDVTTFVIFSVLSVVLTEERLLVEGVFPLRYGGRVTRFGRADEGDLAHKGILGRRQDEPEVAILYPAAVNLYLHHVCGEKMVGVSNGCIVWFPRLLGEGWVREAVGDGAN